MRRITMVALAATVLPAGMSLAQISCPDRSPAAIAGPAAASVKCQTEIGKAARSVVKAKMKTRGKCLAKQTPGLCPQASDTEKIEKAIQKAAGKIASACGDDAVQAGLTTAYNGLTDDGAIASCTFSQSNVAAEVMLGNANGTPGVVSTAEGRDKCVAALGKAANKYVDGVLNTVNKCLGKAMKDGIAGDLAPVCIGAWTGGTFTAPSDAATASKLAKVQDKAVADVAKSCTGGDGPTGYIPSIFACAGSQTVADLQQCIVCFNWAGALQVVEQAYAEDFDTFVTGPATIQAAVSAAADGDKLLIASGEYAEEVTVATDNLKIVGCGSATDDRPRIVPPGGPGPHLSGFSAAGVDGLLFQSLEVFDFLENGIFVTNANGVTFRDVVADGNLNTRYGVYPVQSTDVTLEGCFASGVDDAGLYVGQDQDILVRFNRAEGNVAGIEIENSGNATVHNNFATGNTAGLLVFKLPGPTLQISTGHEVFDNVVVDNNLVNFGEPGQIVSVVPDGTGMLVLSNDASVFHHNIAQGNNSFGFAVIDQQIINILALPNPPVFNPLSPDQKSEGQTFRNNLITGNGTAPDSTPPNASPIGGDIVFALAEDANHNNCFVDNTTGGSDTFITPSDCTP